MPATEEKLAIRTYEQVATIMRRNGDETITRGHIHYYEQSALRKIREALEEGGME